MPAETRCSVSEYMNGDDDLPTCSEQDDETWEDEFFASIVSEQPPLEREEPDDVTFDLEPPPLKIKNFGEAIHSLEDVQAFLDSKGYSDQATVIASAIDLVASLHCNALNLLLSKSEIFIKCTLPCLS